MKTSKDMIRLLASKFCDSWQAKLWPFVTYDVRDALIDSVIMDSVRMANAVDNVAPIPPADLIAFRDAFVAALAAGVPRGAQRRVFKIYNEETP